MGALVLIELRPEMIDTSVVAWPASSTAWLIKKQLFASSQSKLARSYVDRAYCGKRSFFRRRSCTAGSFRSLLHPTT